MNISKLIPLYEQVLLLEISEGFLKKQVERLSKLNVYVEPETIKQMILRFEQLKNSQNTKIEIKNIIERGIENGDIKGETPQDKKRIENLKKAPWSLEFYNFENLEKVVHSFRGVEDKEAKKAAETKSKDSGYGAAELIYESPDVQIFLAKTAQAAIDFKEWLVSHFAEKIKEAGITVRWDISQTLYGWCVAASLNRGNLFNRYRHDNNGASEYFVLDKKSKLKDLDHVLVIHAFKDGRYLVSNAYNSGGDLWLSWPEIEKRKPGLKGTKDIFKFLPYTEDEQLWLITRHAKPEDFAGFTSRVKRAYIELGPKMKIFKSDWIALGTIDPALTHAQRAELTQMNADLQHTYINVRVPPPGNQALPQDSAYVLLDLFKDTSGKEVQERIDKATELAANCADGDYSWEEPLFVDETILNYTLEKGIIKYWKRLIDDCLNDKGVALRARGVN